MGRAPCCDKANVKKGPWSPEEDEKLKAYIEQNGTGGNWIALPQKIGLKRCGKSCRLRWLNYLRPNIKHGGFSEEEDNIICNLYISIGSRWSIIAAQLPGRTDNDIKNYWNTRLKKKLLGRRKQSRRNGSTRDLKDANGEEEEEEEGGTSGSNYSPALSSSALERLQLHMHLQNHPFSLYSDTAQWPKLLPLQEKMIQGLQFSVINEDPNPLHAQPLGMLQQQANDKLENPLNGMMSSDGSIAFACEASNPLNSGSLPSSNCSLEQSNHNAGLGQQCSTFQPEFVLEDFLDHKAIEFRPQDANFRDELGYSRGVMGSSSSSFSDNVWWSSDELGSKSSTSSSWGTISCNGLDQCEGMFQDYVLGYDML